MRLSIIITLVIVRLPVVRSFQLTPTMSLKPFEWEPAVLIKPVLSPASRITILSVFGVKQRLFLTNQASM